jgi:hypothetical protein
MCQVYSIGGGSWLGQLGGGGRHDCSGSSTVLSNAIGMMTPVG